jgi:hypothetical protein
VAAQVKRWLVANRRPLATVIALWCMQLAIPSLGGWRTAVIGLASGVIVALVANSMYAIRDLEKERDDLKQQLEIRDRMGRL